MTDDKIVPLQTGQQATDGETTDAAHPQGVRTDTERMLEALLFAAEAPLSEADLAGRLPDGADVAGALETLRARYLGAGVELAEVAGKYMFRTAGDLAFLLRQEVEETRKLSRAAVETLSIIAFHQPVTRAEVEDIRGVGLSKGTLDVLMEAGWVRMRGRRKTPGRPVTYGTTEDFLVHFGLDSIEDLPGLEDLKAAGLLDSVDDALDALGRFGGPDDTDEDDAQIDLEDAIEQSARAAGEDRRRSPLQAGHKAVTQEEESAPDHEGGGE